MPAPVSHMVAHSDMLTFVPAGMKLAGIHMATSMRTSPPKGRTIPANSRILGRNSITVSHARTLKKLFSKKSSRTTARIREPVAIRDMAGTSISIS